MDRKIKNIMKMGILVLICMTIIGWCNISLCATSKENNIKINFIKIDSLEKAKNAPCIFNNWANFYKGKFISNTILNANSFKKLID